MRMPAEELKKLIGSGPYRMAEIGVYKGDHFAEFLAPDGVPIKTAWLIDSWAREFPGGYAGHTQEEWNELYMLTLSRFSSLPHIHVIRLTSVEAAPFLPNDLDFVYLDAAHDYESVTQDIKTWYPKIRPGGLIWGDDYFYDTVEKAVVEFKKQNPHLNVIIGPTGTQWWAVKENPNASPKDSIPFLFPA